jgi:hypothetical protein
MHEQDELRVDAEESAHRARGSRRRSMGWLPLLAIVAVVAIAFWWWTTQREEPPAPAATAPAASAPASASAAAPASSQPAYPLEATQEGPMSADDVEPALVGLLGKHAVATLLQTGDFPRRAVATLDNLGRAHAPSPAWPVQPTPGRFTVDEGSRPATIAPANSARYTPFVQMAGAVDASRAVALYRRMYPLLQQAYRELGFGDRYLNDRVVEVIDLLLATPQPQGPPEVELIEVKGPVPSQQPWVRWRYVDPQLEGLSSGQKILLRVGPDNERRLKRKLAELREQLVRPARPRGS